MSEDMNEESNSLFSPKSSAVENYYLKRQEETISASQLQVLDGIIQLLESWDTLTVTKVSPVWYVVEGHGKKVQLEVDNPGANLDIVELDLEVEELSFPRKSWLTESAKLTKGNENFAEQKIITKFAIRRDSN